LVLGNFGRGWIKEWRRKGFLDQFLLDEGVYFIWNKGFHSPEEHGFNGGNIYFGNLGNLFGGQYLGELCGGGRLNWGPSHQGLFGPPKFA